MIRIQLKHRESYTGIYVIFEVKLTFEILTVRGQQNLFLTHERKFFWKCQVFETENVSTWVGLIPPIFRFMPNALTVWAVRARHLLSHVCEYWLWWYKYFWSKVNIWNVNCAWATAFVFDTRTDVLLKVSSFWDRKCLDMRGTRTPNVRIHAECSKRLSYQGQTFAVPCLWILALVI